MRHLIFALVLTPTMAFAQTAEEIAALVAQFQQESLDFAKNVASCTAFQQTYMVPGTGASLSRFVEGPSDGLCNIIFEAADPAERDVRCRLDPPTLATFASGWTELANNVLPDGSYKVSYPSDTPDGIRNVMLSGACTVDGQ